MVFKYLPAALLAAAVSVSVAQAQGRPPAELPPAGFAGEQYVDSRGCVFVRAGHGGTVNWVARIDRARKPLCGQTPSVARMAAARRELALPVEAVPPPPVVVRAPAPVVRGRVPAAAYAPPAAVGYGAPTPLRPVAPVAPQPGRLAQVYDDGYLHGWYRSIDPAYRNDLNPNGTPARRGVTTPTTGGHPPLLRRERGCPADAPFGRIYPLADGRNIMLCSNKEHNLRGISDAQLNRYSDARGAGSAPVVIGVPAPAPSGAVRMVRGASYVPVEAVSPPPGYKAAWRDDRLNPHRAGTVAGHQQMMQLWNDKVPQDMATPVVRRAAVSAKNGPAPVAVTGARFVQVGSFGVPENASRAAARLQSMGLPVQVSRSQIGGKPVQVVRAGPFASDGQAREALNAARASGFGDAILRR